MGTIRWTVDPKAEVALRFDDADFLAALQASTGDQADSLERLLGCPPVDATFDMFINDGVVIMARAGITGREDDELGNRAQQSDARKGIKVDVYEANIASWGVWVVAVDDKDRSLPAGLSDRNRKRREEAFGALPAGIKDVLTARLGVHIKAATRGPLRDPNKVAAREGGKAPAPIYDNANGDHADVETNG